MSNRSTSTDALETLGMIHFKPEYRDAIHLAVEPVVAGEDLMPSQHVGLNEHNKGCSIGCKKLLGIVDPFLPRPVKKGESFWLVMFPRQVTSLRHVWESEDFPEVDINGK